MQDYYYNGIWRMDWGLGNPNKTAALVAMLMVAVWSFAYIRRWLFWLSLVLFTGLGISLIHTFSRGGVVAFLFGLTPLIYFALRPWPKCKIIGCIVSIGLILGVSIYLDATGRYEEGLTTEDRSITNRLAIWRVAPKMMIDAPYGWGIGNSGKSYMEWYQPLDHIEQYRTLVNSHLTWLVEFNWPSRFLYISSWIIIFFICWPNEGVRPLSIALGIWIAFAVGAAFSSVAESPWLWILPLISLSAALVIRFQCKLWPDLKMWGLLFVGAGVSMFVLVALGTTSSGMDIHAVNGCTILGAKKPTVWILIDDKIMGQNYGHILRQYLSSSGSTYSIGIADSDAALPTLTGKTVVLAGSIYDMEKLRQILPAAQRIILLNPTFFPQQVGLEKQESRNILVVYGEFTQSPSVNRWASCSNIKRIVGVGDFLPQWPRIVFDKN